MDVSPEALDKHYDQASESERRERRREFLSDISLTSVVKFLHHPGKLLEQL